MFLLAIAGPWICVMGGVVTDKPIVQRLTDLKWAALSSTGEEERVQNLATIFVALRTCVAELKQFYSNLANVNIPPLLGYQPHPRYFPYPNFYKEDTGRDVRFNYISPLDEDDTCVTYLAETVNEDGYSEKIVVKFVSRYGEAVHRYLSSRNRAPRLRYYGPLPRTRNPSTGQENNICRRDDTSSNFQMVVMDYLKTISRPPRDAKHQIEEILIDLHSKGYVFGDLRFPNILFANDKVHLIDFNWSGQYDTSKVLAGIPEAAKVRITQGLEKLKAELKQFARYPGSISQVEVMWVAGVGPEQLILPGHDWGMLAKLNL